MAGFETRLWYHNNILKNNTTMKAMHSNKMSINEDIALILAQVVTPTRYVVDLINLLHYYFLYDYIIS